MFFSFTQKELAKLLSSCNLISPKKSDVEILTYTKFDVVESEVEITCFNSSVFFKSSLKPKTIELDEESKSFLIKTDLIASAISLINDEIVGMEVDFEKHTLSVQGAKSKHTLRINTQLLEDFKLPNEAEEVVESEVRMTLNDVIVANKIASTSVGNPKVIFEQQFLNVCYTLLPNSKELLIVSTDKYRLAKQKMTANYDKTSKEIEFPKNYLIHPFNLQLLPACASDDDEIVTLLFCQNYLIVKLLESTLFMKYGSGNFPDYDKIIPQSFACSFQITTADALEALRQTYFAARTNAINKTVVITVNPTTNELQLSAKTEDGNSSVAIIQMSEYEGVSDEWSQSFNADYLRDYISVVSTDLLLWEANPGKPSVLSPKDQKENQMCLVSGLR
jgi:DNA polymerase III subunit beta